MSSYEKLNNSKEYVGKDSPVFTGSISLGRKEGSVVGENSVAFGDELEASSSYSFAEGYQTKASGDYSHAEGVSTEALGSSSHAEGGNLNSVGSAADNLVISAATYPLYLSEDITLTGSMAKGVSSHAEGTQTYAHGYSSHAEGYQTKALGEFSHAEGSKNTAIGMRAHVEGYYTQADGYDSHAEGYNTITKGADAHAEGSSTVAWGVGSHTEGYNSIAMGNYSHAEGYQVEAAGKGSHSEGSNTFSSGDYSHAEGHSDVSYYYFTGSANATTYTMEYIEGDFEIGVDTTLDSTLEGYIFVYFNSATNTVTTAYRNPTASYSSTSISLNKTLSSSALNRAEVMVFRGGAGGQYAHSEGKSSMARGVASHAEGIETIASGSDAHAEGQNTKASGESSHAEGRETIASGPDAHAEGRNTKATNWDSHAEGFATEANGQYSHAEGEVTKANGHGSHAEGDYTIASSNFQHVQGKYNIEDSTSKYAHIIGNGTSISARSNAHILDWDGNAWFAGDVYVGSTSGTNKDNGSQKLATEKYVDENGGVFIAVYGETTNAELDAAYQAGKAIFCKYNDHIYGNFYRMNSHLCLFTATSSAADKVRTLKCIQDNWSYEEVTVNSFHAETHMPGGDDELYSYGTTDLTENESPLEKGKIYFVI